LTRVVVFLSWLTPRRLLVGKSAKVDALSARATGRHAAILSVWGASYTGLRYAAAADFAWMASRNPDH
jgi:hypothetical protein